MLKNCKCLNVVIAMTTVIHMFHFTGVLKYLCKYCVQKRITDNILSRKGYTMTFVVIKDDVRSLQLDLELSARII